LYYKADSEIKMFDTVSDNAFTFPVQAGEISHVELSGFNASIDFENLTESGTIFVSECETPDSPLYLSLGVCLKLSPNVRLGPDTTASIQVSYNESTIPQGYTAENIDLFHFGLSDIKDITKSRDVVSHTVTGHTKDFSKFVAGIALHSPQTSGSIRKQVFVGQSEISTESSSIMLDKVIYEMSDSPVITIRDFSANIDAGIADTIVARASSAANSARSINVVLLETGPNSGVFQGNFSLTSDASSRASLKIDSGADIMVSYTSAQARLSVQLDEVTESGLVEIRSFLLDPDVEPIRPFGSAIEMQLVDAELSLNPEIGVSMSYAGVDLGSGEEETRPEFLKIFQKNGDSWEEITLSDPLGHDKSAKTISGKTTTAGKFTIGCDPAQQGCKGPGGGGGGLPRPGTGIILDAAASVATSNDSGPRSGGSGGSRSAAIAQTPAGIDIETTVSTRSGPVTITFETVQADTGQLRVEANELSTFEEIFDEIALGQDSDEHGIVHLDGTPYSSAGDVFYIDASAVTFDGMIEVTIPYDEDDVTSISGSESDVRFLHYDEEQGIWEDNTVSVDNLANTVTGRLDSLSPVVAAVIINQESDQLVASDPSFVFSEGISALSVNLNNKLQNDQDYAIIVQVLDQNNIVQHIEWQERSIAASGEENVSMSWDFMEEGIYVIKVFVWTEMQNPSLLSQTSTQSS
jgi:hypothetical protein